MQNTRSLKFGRGVEIVVGAFIQNKDGKILLARSPKWSNKWTIPGGHLDAGESIVQAAIRETKEETGLTVDGIAIFSSGEMINPPDFHRPAHFVYFTVYCQSKSDNISLDQKELKEYRWVTPKQALAMETRIGFKTTIKDFQKLLKSLILAKKIK